ncbi:MAG: ABC-type metal ion transporter, periplasmic subunit [Acidimicrobiales bacterium]|nr:ABC-type metal ion transporter, periplasmic subunit [Acidimicrobiales bacterium]
MGPQGRASRTIATAILAATLVTACGPAKSTPGGRLVVVATTTQVGDFARQVAGNDVEVHQLLRANVDPHAYEASPADLDALARADVVVQNGLGLEHWLDPAAKSAGTKGVRVDASRGVPGLVQGDPHIWLDPRNAAVMVRNIRDGLAKADPAHAADYRRNAAAYTARLDRLFVDVTDQLRPLTNRKLVTNHDAFGYFVRAFHLTFVGAVIPSFDTAAELSGRDLSRLVEQIKAQHVRAVFSETSLPGKAAAAIARRAHVRVVDGAGSLYGDSLGPSGSDGDTYLKMMRHDARTIVENLR